ncbi:hypothetical protein O9929_28295 [Vibrio lentus]|nr:hypothetical protein [Vibrio lentus]
MIVNITQTLADALYLFGRGLRWDYLFVSLEWATTRCAAIWRHPTIDKSTQTELINYENGDQDMTSCCDDLGF